ncbi:MAG: DUF4469 domain-containing protein [Tannerella sp.]|jgi:hypothetical protein|nr:DUF4469 domain-containing protein [Tannerella sp.]
MLDYVLEENFLTDAPDDFRAQVVNVKSHTQSDIVDRILRIGAGLTRSDVVSVLEAEKQVICEMVEEGDAVTTELFNAFPSMQGVYTSVTDSFDPSRHHVRVNLHTGTALRDAATRIKPKKVSGGIATITIMAVTDVKTGSINHLITPNRNLRITGQKLKLAGEQAGVYFINQASGSRTQVDPSDVALNHPVELLVVTPQLPPGEYKLEVITQYSGAAKPLKTPHSVVFDKILTVGQGT